MEKEKKRVRPEVVLIVVAILVVIMIIAFIVSSNRFRKLAVKPVAESVQTTPTPTYNGGGGYSSTTGAAIQVIPAEK